MIQLHAKKIQGLNIQKNNLIKPPEINPCEFIEKKISWRYKKGKPNIINSRIINGDSTIELKEIVKKAKKIILNFLYYLRLLLIHRLLIIMQTNG